MAYGFSSSCCILNVQLQEMVIKSGIISVTMYFKPLLVITLALGIAIAV